MEKAVPITSRQAQSVEHPVPKVSSAPALPQYTPAFLASSFGLTHKQAKSIIDVAEGDRDKAADLASALRFGGR